MRLSRNLVILFASLTTSLAAQSSYIGRLWNTKSYDKIIEYSPKGETLSGRDNMTVVSGDCPDCIVPPDCIVRRVYRRRDLDPLFRSCLETSLTPRLDYRGDVCACVV